jgi:capsular exopolysaccharide synthesis family protein
MESNSELQRFQSDLKHLLLIVKRRWRPALAGSGAVFCLAAIVTFIQGPTYEASGKLLLEKRSPTSSLTESGKELSDLISVGSSDPVASEMEVIRSVPIAEKVIDVLMLKDEKGDPVKPELFAERKMSVKKLRETDILKIAYKSKSPTEAAEVVNKLMNVYIENSILIDHSKVSQRGKFIAQELPKVEAEVRKAEDEIRKFKEANQISDLETEKRSTAEAISTIKGKLTESSTQLKGSTSRSKMIQNRLGINPLIAMERSSVNQTPEIQEVITDLQSSENQLATAHNRYEDNHPIILDLKDKVSTLKNVLNNRVRKVVESQVNLSNRQLQTRGIKQSLLDDYVKLQFETTTLNTEINSLNYEKSLYLDRLKVLPRLEQTYKELQRKLTASQSTYTMLLEKSHEIQIAANQGEGSARIVEYARPPENFRVSPILIKLLLGLLTGGLFGIAVTLILEARDISIKTIEEIKERFGYTMLGVIPDFEFSGHSSTSINGYEPNRTQLIVQDFPSSPISEAYRMLNSNLKFMDTDDTLKTIIITSSVPAEGKSTLSANLALAMAQQGLNVLLIDGDMRRPTQHNIWQIRKTHGLSDLIVGQTDLKNSLQVVRDGLTVLTSGPIPPNPGALLESKKMASLVEQFSKQFDRVIIDSPPLLPTNDPRILTGLGDGVILVASPGTVTSSNSESVKELLRQLEDKVLGVVANKVIPRHEPDSYYYYANEYQSNSEEALYKVEV